ncbi:MAG: hypothetical protein AAB295_07725 [Chloroflexota bacterium]
MTREEPPLPPRATGIALGLWMTVLIVLALFVVPSLFALCAPPGTTGAPGP